MNDTAVAGRGFAQRITEGFATRNLVDPIATLEEYLDREDWRVKSLNEKDS